MNHNAEPIYPNDQARDEALRADQSLMETPLPYSHVRHYPHEAARQIDLAAAEKANIARAASELGMTSAEWQAKRAHLGRSPTRSDV